MGMGAVALKIIVIFNAVSLVVFNSLQIARIIIGIVNNVSVGHDYFCDLPYPVIGVGRDSRTRGR